MSARRIEDAVRTMVETEEFFRNNPLLRREINMATNVELVESILTAIKIIEKKMDKNCDNRTPNPTLKKIDTELWELVDEHGMDE